MIPGSANALLLASAAVEGGYQISRSLRFNSSDSAYLSRTPASAGNRRTWTWAGWVKRSSLGSFQMIFGGGTTSNDTDQFVVYFTTGDTLRITSGVTIFRETSQVFRDPSSWYHLIVAVDTAQSTANDRIKFYVNGTQVTTFGTTNNPTQNADTGINTTTFHAIGRNSLTPEYYFSGYLSDIYFIDGQQLTPSSFTEVDATTGQLIPKAYTGTYGTNGFHLPFSDNSTAAALGTDTSGAGNNWTVNNISVAAGAGNDSLVDTPTNYGTDTGAGGEVRGNYATLNGLKTSYTGGTVSLTNGNLDLSVSMTANQISVPATIGVSTGKWYWEVLCNSITKQYGYDGAIGVSSSGDVNNGTANPSTNRTYIDDGNFWNGSTGSAYGASWTAGDVIGVALDLDAGTLVFYKNGASQGQAISGLTGTWFPVIMSNNVVSFTTNWGQRPFAYTAPSGYKALCTTNLPAPVVAKPNTVMDVALDSGANILTATKALCGGNANFLWIKDRVNGSTNHHLIDIVRDPQLDGTPFLASNSTSDETTLGTYSAPSGNSVGWGWYAGGSTTTYGPIGSGADNESALYSITSTVRANASAGFSIVGWTGNGAAASIGHGLGVEPHLIIHKFRGGSSNWSVYTKATGAGGRLKLNTTDAFSSDGTFPTTPTSSLFYVNAGTNDNGVTIIAYCFAPVAGYSSFGSYTGNGSADGPFVFCGFRPRWILAKCSSQDSPGGTSAWWIHDAARNPYNQAQAYLYANSSGSEGNNYGIDILSNGFKVRTSDATWNASGATFVYAAFAESPLQYARAR